MYSKRNLKCNCFYWWILGNFLAEEFPAFIHFWPFLCQNGLLHSERIVITENIYFLKAGSTSWNSEVASKVSVEASWSGAVNLKIVGHQMPDKNHERRQRDWFEEVGSGEWIESASFGLTNKNYFDSITRQYCKAHLCIWYKIQIML